MRFFVSAPFKLPALALPCSVVHDAGRAEESRSTERAPDLFSGFLVCIWDELFSVEEADVRFALAAPINPDVELASGVVFFLIVIVNHVAILIFVRTRSLSSSSSAKASAAFQSPFQEIVALPVPLRETRWKSSSSR